MARLRRLDRLIGAASSWQIAGVVIALLLLGSLAWPVPATFDAPAAVSLRLTDRAGGLLRTAHPDGRGQPVALDAVAPAVTDALLATEDRRFRRHPGIDPLALARAAWTDLRHGRIVSGGSTITMQVARLLRNQSDRGWLDKLLEMHLALRLELRHSKDEILARWLNRVSFGNRTHGIEAAARRYFDKSARDLTTAEAAYLVGLPQSPSRYNPFRHPERAKARQRHVLRAMERTDHLTAAERRRIETLPLDLQAPDAVFRAPHLTEHLLRTLPDEAALTELRTTIDPALQATVTRIVRGHIALLHDRSVTNAAAVVLDNRTGAVRAYVGSADFWDARAGGQNDGVRMLRQPGSALKPFTYARALATRRYTPASILADIPLQVLEAGGAFAPENYDARYHGPVSLREALASSYNVPAVRLARALGPEAVLATLHDVGFASLDAPAAHYGVGLTLGNGEVQLIELARAYAGLARGGTLPPVHTERWHVTVRGDTLRPALAAPVPMGISSPVAYLIADILQDPEARAPAFGRGGPLELPSPTAVKTGTSKDYRDNWAVGTTPQHTVAVWAGNFDGTPMRWVSGVSGAGPIFKAIMQELGPSGDFTRPAGLVTATVCPASGQRPGAHCPAPHREIFLTDTAPTDTCTVHRHVALDTRSGLLADDDTPARFVQHKRFTVHPARFHPWMRAQGLPFPPAVTHAATAAHTADTADAAFTDRLQIQYPEDGTTYRLDPVLRADHQQIHLRGTADAAFHDVHWRVDGIRLDADYRDATWRLQPGTHTVSLHAVQAGGIPVQSRPARVRVYGYRKATASSSP